MTDISAGDNHFIQIAPNRWRVLYGDKPTAEATPRGFRYGNRFGGSRRLPIEGELLVRDISQVVLGWEERDESWHLGLVVTHAIAEPRNSRWVEVAYWPDPEIGIFQDIATRAAQELAQVMAVPLYIAPVQRSEAIEQEPEVDLPPLPINLGEWVLNETIVESYIIQRTRTARLRQLGRVFWYLFWMVIYFVVSIATLTSKIALPNAGTLVPNPQLLPYLGVGIGFFLLGLAIHHLLIFFREPTKIFINHKDAVISAWHNQRLIWSLPATGLQSVYISEEVKRKETSNAIEHGEINLHLGGGKFHFVLALHNIDDELATPLPDYAFPRTENAIFELKRAHVYSDLQAVAVYIAEALDLDAWYDLRVK